MILVDTSVWVDHLRRADRRLIDELVNERVLMHPLVIGEIACGIWPQRAEVLALLQELPMATLASHVEVLSFIERQKLAGRGIGYIDIHLIASTLMTPGARLWTRDRRLTTVATELGLAHHERAT